MRGKTIRRVVLCLLPAVVALGIYVVLPHFPTVAEYVFARGIYRGLSFLLGNLTAWLPFSLTELLVVLALPAVIVLVILLVRRLRRSPDRRATAGRAARGVTLVLSSALLLYMLMHGAAFYRYPVAQLMDLEEVKPSADFLEKVCIDLAQRASQERQGVAEDEAGCMRLSQPMRRTLRMADDGFVVLEEEYAFLRGSVWRAKPVLLSHWWSYTGITGLYFPLLGEANVNIDVPHSGIPFTSAHELVHTRGFAREDECNFLAYLTAIHHPSPDFRYSGYLMAYIYCSNALYAYDTVRWEAVYAYCSEGVRRDLREKNVYWDPFEGPVQDLSNAVNDGFLSSQGQADGVLSYDRVVELILRYYQTNGWCL